MLEAVILAGGLGTRLKSVVNELPKPMADVHGRPFLAHLFDYLARQNISRVVLAVGYRHEMIFNYFRNSYQGIQIEYAVETEPLGTGGALLNALLFLKSKSVCVLNGDTYFPIPMDDFERFHRSHNGYMSMALRIVEDVSRFGSVDCDAGGCVIDIEEKGRVGSGTINGGIYIIDVSEFQKLPFPHRCSLETDILEPLQREKRLFGMLYDMYFVDIGIPSEYYRFTRQLGLTK